MMAQQDDVVVFALVVAKRRIDLSETDGRLRVRRDAM
jgi:hypothetical protein